MVAPVAAEDDWNAALPDDGTRHLDRTVRSARRRRPPCRRGDETSGERIAKLLVPDRDLRWIWVLCKVLSSLSSVEAMELLLERLSKAPTNRDFLEAMSQG